MEIVAFDRKFDRSSFSCGMVLTMEGMRISAITRFIDSGLLPHFGLPRTLPSPAG